MSTEPFIGEVKILGFAWPPQGYQLCQGQILSIASNTAMFSLLGTTFGGNGSTTFGLPDLRGRMPIGQGAGPGLPDCPIGQVTGSNSATLVALNMPAHAHAATGITVQQLVNTTGAGDTSPQNNFLAPAGSDIYAGGATVGAFGGALAVGGSTAPAGANAPFSIANPSLGMNYSIATQGIFPSRQ